MSKHEWERGSIKLPKSEATRVIKALRDKFNAQLNAEIALLTKVHAAVTAAYKGKRNVNWRDAVKAELAKPIYTNAKWEVLAQSRVSEFQNDLVDLLLRKVEAAGAAPKIKLIASVTNKITDKWANAKTVSFDAGCDGTINYDSKNATFKWYVSENNHAVDDARNSIMGAEFFRLMGTVKWTRTTGGELVGNDEYNQDSENAGGGANYTTATYGGLGDQAEIDNLRMRGFSVKQATAMVKKGKEKPAPRRF